MTQTGPGVAGVGGLFCLALVAATFLSYLPPLPTAAITFLLVLGVGLVAFAAVRSLRSPA